MSKLLLLLSLFISKTTEEDGRFGETEFRTFSSRRSRRDDLSVLDSTSSQNSYAESNPGRSAYFSGSEIIQFQATKISNIKFTVELWIKPEGGQLPVVPIVSYFDQCVNDKEASIWKLGLRENLEHQDQRVYFSLQTQRVHEPHVISAHVGYRVGSWMHVAAVFNGTALGLFVNQAQVAVSHKQLSPASESSYTKCKVLELGGDSRNSAFFRGSVDDLRVWNIAKSHRSIIDDLKNNKFKSIPGNILAVSEEFEAVHNNGRSGPSYVPVTLNPPELIRLPKPKDLHQIEVKKPLCGITVCDNQDVVRGYKKNELLRRRKILHYRLINVADDDGRNPLVTRAQIEIQHGKLNEAFSRYNITWKKTEHLIKNSSLRHALITSGDAEEHGHKNMNVPVSESVLEKRDLVNGITNAGSKKFYHDPLRYGHKRKKKNVQTLTVKEFKQLVSLNNRQSLNVFIVKWNSKTVYGLATLPWEKSALGIQGGTLLSADRFGKLDGVNDMIHELGHILGLWHVHRGFELGCDHACFETHPSMELGDLCADTNPTPVNSKCTDVVTGKCGKKVYTDTPFRNYMGYGTGPCLSEFTKDQVARMHCYVDMMYQTWIVSSGPSAIAVPPKILSYNDGTLQMEWLRPIAMGTEFTRKNCNSCDFKDMKLCQYALTAFSPVKPGESRIWAPEQATGPPDAEKCSHSKNAWVQYREKTCTLKTCFIELGFQQAVIPSEIKVWVRSIPSNSQIDIELLHVDGTMTSLGQANVQCDTPFTKRITAKGLVDKVRLRINNTYVAIDAVQLISQEKHPNCMKCPRVEYAIERMPRFQTGGTKIVAGTQFYDTKVRKDISYTYRIRAIVGNLVGPPSSPLTFSAIRGFCGDGVIQEENNEDCDDGNLRDGDGCSIQCRKEDVFKCKGQPSICYKYEGDGTCEDFEKEISMVDCGIYVPDGFEDQWAISTETNPKYLCKSKSNPISVLTGPPPLDLKCSHSKTKEKKSWQPCEENNYLGDFWIEVGFENAAVASAVIIYIASDGKQFTSFTVQRYVNVELIDTFGNKHNIGHNDIKIDCKRHPLVIPVYHDMTKPYFKTKRVRMQFSKNSGSASVSAVALRSSTIVNPAVVSDCNLNKQEYYNPKTHSCYSYQCSRPVCKPFVVKHAQLTCTGHNDGDTCEMKCHEGYIPAKTITTKCILGKWTKPLKSCVPTNCGKLNVTRAIVECKEGTTYGNICFFHCISPARLVGNSNQVKCLKDGLWSARKASCQMQCTAPPQIENGIPLNEECDANHMKARRRNEMGTAYGHIECLDVLRNFFQSFRFRFECPPGFTVFSKSSAAVGKHVKLTCTEDGQWKQDAYCKQITCPQLSLFHKQVYNCSNENSYESVCITVCPRNKVLHEVRCQKDGTWSSSFEYCKYKGKCDFINTKQIFFGSCKNTVTSVCKPECKIKDHDVIARAKGVLANVKKIVCLPDLRWFPDPKTLQCLPFCDKNYVPNEYCDCSNNDNNNAYCNLDHGNCCIVSKMKNVVCKCEDPNSKFKFKIQDGGGGSGGSYDTTMADTDGVDDDIGVFHSFG
eukprot:gene10275-11330_t